MQRLQRSALAVIHRLAKWLPGGGGVGVRGCFRWINTRHQLSAVFPYPLPFNVRQYHIVKDWRVHCITDFYFSFRGGTLVHLSVFFFFLLSCSSVCLCLLLDRITCRSTHYKKKKASVQQQSWWMVFESSKLRWDYMRRWDESVTWIDEQIILNTLD